MFALVERGGRSNLNFWLLFFILLVAVPILSFALLLALAILFNPFGLS